MYTSLLESNPGKGKLIEPFNLWLNVPADSLKIISRVVNMLHAASLVSNRVLYCVVLIGIRQGR